jgi:hypothetical protein
MNIRKTIFTFTFLTLVIFTTYCQNIHWQKCFSGGANSIRQTEDGGFIVAGSASSIAEDFTGNRGLDNFWILKLDDIGSVQWQKFFGGSNNDIANDIQETFDGGYIVAGLTASNDGDVSGYKGGYNDFWVVKLSSSGIIQWQKCLGGTGDDQANSIQQTSDSGYVVAGSTRSVDGDVSGNHENNCDYWIVKLDVKGAFQWQKCLGGSDIDVATSIRQSSEGGYIVAGYAESTDGDVSGHHAPKSFPDYWIVKLSSAGTIQWQKCLGGGSIDRAYDVRQTRDGGYIVAGETYSDDGDVSGYHGQEDYWIVKLDTVGVIQWQKCFGGSNFDIATCIQETFDGGYVVAGYSDSHDGDVSGLHRNYEYSKFPVIYPDLWIIKLNQEGEIQWQNCFGGTSVERTNSIWQTNDSGYIVAGNTYSSDGDVSCYNGNNGVWIIKIDTINTETGIDETKNDLPIQVYPTITADYIIIETVLKYKNLSAHILSMNGQLMQTTAITTEKTKLNLEKLPSGLYLIEFITDNDYVVLKICKQ